MKDTKDFQERYNRWKNGERYWDIRGVELPKYDTGKYVTVEKDDGSVYNVNPNVADSSEITVTTPEVEVVAQKPQWMIDRDDKIGQIIPTQYTLREDNTPLSSQVDKFIDKYKYKTNNVILSGLANAADDWRRDKSPLRAAARYFGWWNPIASSTTAILDDKLNTRSNTPKLIIPEMIMDYGNKYGAAVRGYNHLMSKDGLKKTTDFTDIAKTMYHPTFSDESIFSGNVSDFNPLGIIGGHWNEAGTEYTPSASQLQNYFNYDVTRNYLNRNEDHPVKINLPKYGGGKIGGFVHRMGPLIYQGLVSRGVKNINAAYANLMRQISHESGYGTSGISRQHNYGGIKIPGSNNYRKFKSDRDFTDYYLDLMTSRYRNAIDAKDLNGFVNELGSKGYFRGQTAAQYLGKLNTLKSLDRAVAQDLANRRDFYNQTTGIQQNPETNEPEFVQPVPKEQPSIEVPYLDPQKLGTITFPVNQPIIDIRTILPKLKPMVYQYWKSDESFDHGKSGIHINPANRGKFNATKKRTGKTTKELTHSKNPLTRKRAIFALNASKWNKK